jgi:hypothetical protein
MLKIDSITSHLPAIQAQSEKRQGDPNLRFAELMSKWSVRQSYSGLSICLV